MHAAGRTQGHMPLLDFAISAWALLWSMIAMKASCSSMAGLLMVSVSKQSIATVTNLKHCCVTSGHPRAWFAGLGTVVFTAQ
jgi:hypothetical protein